MTIEWTAGKSDLTLDTAVHVRILVM